MLGQQPARALELRLVRHGPGDGLSPHTDRDDKIFSHVIYLNRTWHEDWGGCLEVLSNNDPGAVAGRIVPRLGASALMARSNNSWHQVTAIVRHVRRNGDLCWFTVCVEPVVSEGVNQSLLHARRVLVLGCPGAGKSTFSRRLSVQTGLPVYHLDDEYWGPYWARPTDPFWEAKQEALTARERWIIDGNYLPTLRIRASKADLIVLVDTPALTCVRRIFFGLGVFAGATTMLCRPKSETRRWPGSACRQPRTSYRSCGKC